METRPQSPQPPGPPRWVAMFYQSSSASWSVGAESLYRSPVLHAVGEMAQTVRARGETATVDLWGPEGDAWKRFDSPTRSAPAAASPPALEQTKPKESGTLGERMTDRRHQVLMAGLSKAGLYDLTTEDTDAIRATVDGLDEITVRRIAHWLAIAGGSR
ncbi:hypothetical protein [Streptomyces sp. GC420]|uniref:hypothetical protein n=1 Tax=Streptomyces sp. GC420 TaxID=2697568 RepID=UPI001AA1D0EA|nr:hypothetical protein [Streptomyces sp. GC420]NBM17486.1 hypothetical protein [Streptomyces sp. GC420]